MKIITQNTLDTNILDKVDGVIVDYGDRENILDLLDAYPNMIYFIRRSYGKESDIKELIKYDTLTNHNLFILTDDDFLMYECHKNGIKFGFSFFINNFEDLYRYYSKGAKVALISGVLAMSQDDLKNYDLLYIINPTGELVYENSSPCNFTVRPEDAHYYGDNYYAYFGSSTSDSRHETTLIDIYKEGIWKGKLEFLFPGIGPDVENTLIDTNYGHVRLNCRQVCLASPDLRKCKICNTALKFASQKHQLKETVDKLK